MFSTSGRHLVRLDVHVMCGKNIMMVIQEGGKLEKLLS